ncbi:MAG: ABC transporter ATP-binding protein [Planctomycetaceae bacterium]|nr:ABC transporter ATP-binding protein [Planctomycetaceae bacterium]MCB9951106.1 ABC transporter ATP-binding protein [Planctomycetaceae bacterium]
MESFTKLLPHLYPYRYRIWGSVLLGVLVAALWGANLSVAFPVVKILLEQKDLKTYVNETIATAEAEEESISTALAQLEKDFAQLDAEGVGPSDSRRIDMMHQQLNWADNLAKERQTLYQFNLLQHYVMPWVPNNDFHTFAWIIGLLIFATAVKGVFIFFQDVLVGNVAESVVMSVRKDMLKKVLGLDYQTLASEGTPGLMSRFTFDSEQLSQGITLLGGRMIREPLKCIACMGFALYINWRLTLLSLLFIPLLGLFLNSFGKMLKRASRRMMESMSQIYKVLEETFEGLKVVIAFNAQKKHRGDFDNEYQRYFSKAMRVVKIDAAAKPLLELLGLMAMFLALVPGAYLVLRGQTHIWGVRLTEDVMSPSTLTLLYAMLVGMLDPCRKLSAGFARLKRAAAAIDRIDAMMHQETKIVDPEAPKTLPRHSKEIEFRDISFQYHTRIAGTQRGLVLDHMTLKAEFGEVIAVVGQNGCGKSTLLNLLPRYYDPDVGSILIDGIPITDVKLDDLRSQIGVVTQDTLLFDQTIRENVRYGRPTASDEEVAEAAKRAHLTPIIESMPQGFDTVIGEKGKELSGGQRQRIALARAILRNPAILILDEATSATDAESETLIHQTLKEFVKDRTTFLVTHSMSKSLLDFVTRIVVIENGKIVASGAHEQLLETCPLYQRLYHAPSRQDIIPISAGKAAS